MARTRNSPEVPDTPGLHKQAGRPGDSVSDRRGTAHYRRRVSYVARAQLDELLGVPRVADLVVVELDYAAAGLILGIPERRAAGLALLERERAA